jgi:hypothetical protein
MPAEIMGNMEDSMFLGITYDIKIVIGNTPKQSTLALLKNIIAALIYRSVTPHYKLNLRTFTIVSTVRTILTISDAKINFQTSIFLKNFI